MNFEIKKKHKSFEGETVFCSHNSKSAQTQMNFSYFKPNSNQIENVILWLSGLTCTEENFITKAGAQSYLGHTKTAIICADTSPRGLNLPNEDDSYDFGSGASFYLNATEDPWKTNYQMESYVIDEFVPLAKEIFQTNRISISGHSMGGHGALTLGLKNPDLFYKISAFSPIVNPMNSPWGEKAFKGYLGDDRNSWKHYDACELLNSGHKHKNNILIDQGLSDEFFEQQLKTKNIEKVCSEVNQPLEVRYQEGYDHSYYFIASFIEDHIKFLTQ